MNNFKNKKVLIMGLGLLGGGVASVKWFVKHGADVVVTDLKTKQKLQSSIKILGPTAKKVRFVLGRHNETDFKTNDYIVVNPDVRKESKFLAIAKNAGKKLINDAVVFFDEIKNPVIAVTGTRGKTTTVNWLNHFLKSKYPHSLVGGNSSNKPLLLLTDSVKDKVSPITVELSSWQLELLLQSRKLPDIAIITNIYPDHLNRYDSIKSYASAKANIFKNQTIYQKLILNYDNKWTKYFLSRQPKGKVYFFSNKFLPKNKKGIFVKNESIRIRKNNQDEILIPKRNFAEIKKWGAHNIANLLPALLIADFYGVSQKNILEKLKTMPQIKYREELIVKNKNLSVINDSAATSPDATIVALKRFGKICSELVLITGGTDKNLEFYELAKIAKKYVKPQNLFLLNGSATAKIIKELESINYFKVLTPQLFESLPKILKTISQLITNYKLPIIVIFSPASASFEKFKNEFDRGEKFNLYSKELV